MNGDRAIGLERRDGHDIGRDPRGMTPDELMSLGHVEPTFSFWTTSGEFVFVAILAGWQSVAAVFIASTVLEVVRSFSSAYFPNTWQLALGLFLLFVIRFLPKGIGSLWMRGSTR